MNNFQVGDKVCKKYADTTIYTIVSIQTFHDGNFYDGHTTTMVAVLDDGSSHVFSFDNNMANIHIKYNNLVKYFCV